MTGTRLYINAHGERLHQAAIAIATLEAHARGYHILDGRFFRDKFYWKAEPDLYIGVPGKITTERGKKYDTYKKYVIEIETHATRESVEKKMKQFQESITDHELIVIRLNGYDGGLTVDQLWELIAGRLP